MIFSRKNAASIEVESALVDSTKAAYMALSAAKEALETQINLLDSRVAPASDRLAELGDRLTVCDSPELYQATAAELAAGLAERDAVIGTVKNLRIKLVALEREALDARQVWRTAQSQLAGAKAHLVLTQELKEQVATAYDLLIEAGAIDAYTAQLPEWLRIVQPRPVAPPVIEVAQPHDETGAVFAWAGYGPAPMF
jgi:predicted  nucleic acid-binding Zn-ribbon protein